VVLLLFAVLPAGRRLDVADLQSKRFCVEKLASRVPGLTELFH